MTETHPAANPQEVQGHGIDAAAARIASLLEADPRPEAEEPEEAPPDAQPADEEEAASDDGDADEGEAEEAAEEAAEDAETAEEPEEQAAEPAIPAPSSMTDEQKAEFAKLPPAAQKFLAEREKSLTADYTRKTQEIADSRKQAQSHIQALEQERRHYTQGLTIVGQQINAALNAVSQEELNRLYTENPAEWAKANELRRQGQDRLRAIQQELATVERTEAERQKAQLLQQVQENARKLPELIPEWRDAGRASAEKRDLVDYLKTTGFTPDEIGQAADARLIAMGRKAMLYDKQQKAQPAMVKKVREAPKTVKPSAPSGKTTATEEADRIRARLRKTGKVDDAAAAIALKLRS